MLRAFIGALALLLGFGGPAWAITNTLATGVAAYDKYDLAIIARAADYGHPLPRLLKAQAWWESDEVFNPFSTSADTPCGIPAGWTSAQSRSFGLFQITPACGEGVPHMLLSNNKPNLSQTRSNASYTTSVYNEALNIDRAVHSIAEGFKYFKGQFPGCSNGKLALHAAAGWVGDWDEMTACGDYGNADMQSYVATVVGFYVRYWGPYPY